MLNDVSMYFVLPAAHVPDVREELLSEHTGLVVRGDQGPISAAIATQLVASSRLQVLTIQTAEPETPAAPQGGSAVQCPART